MTTFGKADARRKGSVSVGVLIYNLQARDGKEGQEPMMYGKRKREGTAEVLIHIVALPPHTAS